MEHIKTLFLAANPVGTSQLALDEEIREITQKIRLADGRDVLQVISSWAVRPDDLLQYLNQHKPHIVHFSGHGSQDGELILLDNQRQPKPVSPVAIKALFTTLKDNIQVVVLNACFSRIQGEAINEVIDFVVGMDKAIGDRAAITFAASFYRALGFNRTIQEAFDQAIAALLLEGIPENKTPQLLIKEGVTSDIRLMSTPRISRTEDNDPKLKLIHQFEQRRDFVGRSRELDGFEDMLKVHLSASLQKTRQRQSVLLISGPGGMGKSWLLNEICAKSERRGLITIHIDFENDLIGSEDSFLNTLLFRLDEHNIRSQLSRFNRTIKGIQSIQDASGAGREIQILNTNSMFAPSILHGSKYDGSQSMQYIGPSAMQQFARNIADDLQAIAANATIVLAFDSYESVGEKLSKWLHRNFFGRLKGNLIIVIAGRQNVKRQFAHTFDMVAVKQWELTELSRSEVAQRLSQFVPSNLIEEVTNKIYRVSGGMPLALSICIVNATQVEMESRAYLEAVTVEEIVSYLLQGLSENEQSILFAICNLRNFNDELLTEMLEPSNFVSVHSYLEIFPFLHRSEVGWNVHKRIRLFVIEYLKVNRPSHFRHLQRKALGYWTKQAEQAVEGVPKTDYYIVNSKWLVYIHNKLYHALLFDEEEGLRVLSNEFFDNLKYRDYLFQSMVDIAKLDEVKSPSHILGSFINLLQMFISASLERDSDRLIFILPTLIEFPSINSEHREFLESTLRMLKLTSRDNLDWRWPGGGGMDC